MSNPSLTYLRTVTLAALLLLAGCIGGDNTYGHYYTSPTARSADYISTAKVVVPANAPSISDSYFRLKDPAAGGKEGHLGIDIIAPKGTPVIAAAKGRVVRVFTEPLYGNQIVIDHGFDEDGQRIFTHYKHLQKQTVGVGETVARGQQIGALGNTGVLSGGILHLHFEVQIQNHMGRPEPVDPHKYWMDGIGKVTCFDKTAVWPDTPFRITYPVVCK